MAQDPQAPQTVNVSNTPLSVSVDGLGYSDIRGLFEEFMSPIKSSVETTQNTAKEISSEVSDILSVLKDIKNATNDVNSHSKDISNMSKNLDKSIRQQTKDIFSVLRELSGKQDKFQNESGQWKNALGQFTKAPVFAGIESAVRMQAEYIGQKIDSAVDNLIRFGGTGSGGSKTNNDRSPYDVAEIEDILRSSSGIIDEDLLDRLEKILGSRGNGSGFGGFRGAADDASRLERSIANMITSKNELEDMSLMGLRRDHNEISQELDYQQKRVNLMAKGWDSLIGKVLTFNMKLKKSSTMLSKVVDRLERVGGVLSGPMTKAIGMLGMAGFLGSTARAVAEVQKNTQNTATAMSGIANSGDKITDQLRDQVGLIVKASNGFVDIAQASQMQQKLFDIGISDLERSNDLLKGVAASAVEMNVEFGDLVGYSGEMAFNLKLSGKQTAAVIKGVSRLTKEFGMSGRKIMDIQRGLGDIFDLMRDISGASVEATKSITEMIASMEKSRGATDYIKNVAKMFKGGRSEWMKGIQAMGALGAMTNREMRKLGVTMSDINAGFISGEDLQAGTEAVLYNLLQIAKRKQAMGMDPNFWLDVISGGQIKGIEQLKNSVIGINNAIKNSGKGAVDQIEELQTKLKLAADPVLIETLNNKIKTLTDKLIGGVTGSLSDLQTNLKKTMDMIEVDKSHGVKISQEEIGKQLLQQIDKAGIKQKIDFALQAGVKLEGLDANTISNLEARIQEVAKGNSDIETVTTSVAKILEASSKQNEDLSKEQAVLSMRNVIDQVKAGKNESQLAAMNATVDILDSIDNKLSSAVKYLSVMAFVAPVVSTGIQIAGALRGAKIATTVAKEVGKGVTKGAAKPGMFAGLSKRLSSVFTGSVLKFKTLFSGLSNAVMFAGLSKGLSSVFTGSVLKFKSLIAGLGSTIPKIIEKTGLKGVGKIGAKIIGKLGFKSLGKVGTKSLVKKIPIIGLIAGLGFGAHRLLKGDITGAVGEVASGAASTVPGLGTAASVGIDAALIARDIARDPTENIAEITKKAITTTTTTTTTDDYDNIKNVLSEQKEKMSLNQNYLNNSGLVKLSTDIQEKSNALVPLIGESVKSAMRTAFAVQKAMEEEGIDKKAVKKAMKSMVFITDAIKKVTGFLTDLDNRLGKFTKKIFKSSPIESIKKTTKEFSSQFSAITSLVYNGIVEPFKKMPVGDFRRANKSIIEMDNIARNVQIALMSMDETFGKFTEDGGFWKNSTIENIEKSTKDFASHFKSIVDFFRKGIIEPLSGVKAEVAAVSETISTLSNFINMADKLPGLIEKIPAISGKIDKISSALNSEINVNVGTARTIAPRVGESQLPVGDRSSIEESGSQSEQLGALSGIHGNTSEMVTLLGKIQKQLSSSPTQKRRANRVSGSFAGKKKPDTGNMLAMSQGSKFLGDVAYQYNISHVTGNQENVPV